MHPVRLSLIAAVSVVLAVFLVGCAASGGATQPAPGSDGPSTAPVATPVPAGPPGVRNTDGTISFPVDQFTGHPETLDLAVTELGLTAWATAGATLQNAAASLSSGRTVSSEAIRIGRENRTRFADALLVSGWQKNPKLVQLADQMASRNTDTVFKFLLTANEQNAANPTHLTGQYVQPQSGWAGEPAYQVTITTNGGSASIVSDTGSRMVVKGTTTTAGNETATYLSSASFKAANSRPYPDTKARSTQTVTYVEETSAAGVPVYKIADVTINYGWKPVPIYPAG